MKKRRLKYTWIVGKAGALVGFLVIAGLGIHSWLAGNYEQFSSSELLDRILFWGAVMVGLFALIGLYIGFLMDAYAQDSVNVSPEVQLFHAETGSHTLAPSVAIGGKQFSGLTQAAARQLGVLVALAYVAGYALGVVFPVATTLSLVLLTGGGLLVFYTFNRLVRILLASSRPPGVQIPFGLVAIAAFNIGRATRKVRWIFDVPIKEPDYGRIIGPCLALLRRFDVIAVLVLVLGCLLGRYARPYDEESAVWAAVCFFGIYYLVDRMMRVLLGSQYRPEEEMRGWFLREYSYKAGFKAVGANLKRPVVMIIFVLIVVGIIRGLKALG